MCGDRSHRFRFQRIEEKLKAINAGAVDFQRRNTAFQGGILFFCPLDDKEWHAFLVGIQQKCFDRSGFAAACATGHQHMPQHIFWGKADRLPHFKRSPDLQGKAAFMERFNCREKLLVALPFQPEAGITTVRRCASLRCVP